MAKYNRNRRPVKGKPKRIWGKNVGDPNRKK